MREHFDSMPSKSMGLVQKPSSFLRRQDAEQIAEQWNALDDGRTYYAITQRAGTYGSVVEVHNADADMIGFLDVK